MTWKHGTFFTSLKTPSMDTTTVIEELITYIETSWWDVYVTIARLFSCPILALLEYPNSIKE